MSDQTPKKVDFFEFRASIMLVDPTAHIRHGNKWLYVNADHQGPIPTTEMYERYRTVLEAFDLPVFPKRPAEGFLVRTNIDRFTPWGDGKTPNCWEGYGITKEIRTALHYMMMAEIEYATKHGRRWTRRPK